jgi:Flp pilus assembly protein TadG
MTKFASLMKRFTRNCKGSVTLNFGFAAVPLIVAMGVAVDYSRLTGAKADLQSAADAVSLDAATSWSGGATNLTARAQNFLALNPPKGIDPADITVTAEVLPGFEKVKVSLSTDVDVVFDKFLGSGDKSNVTAEATTTLPIFSDYHKGEVALVLDYSGSMKDYVGGQKKYITMRNNIVGLVNSLSQGGINNDVKFSVIPFSAAVRATIPANLVYGNTASGNTTVCLEDRAYPYNITAASPTGTDEFNDTKFREASVSCSSYSSRYVNIRDLTTDHAGTVAAINSMTPVGNTHITLGAEMGWHMLKPGAPYTQGVAMHTADTLKAVVIFTDGMQTSGGNGPDGSWSVSDAESNLATVCAAMKNDGIRVFTVSFDLDDSSASTAETRLRDCSGPSIDEPARTAAEVAAAPHPFYFNAETNDELTAAFGTIRNQLARNMFLSE